MNETRARKRIRMAVESRGFTLESLDWEPAYYAGEMMGVAGGWRGYTTVHDFGGLSVEECLADIDALLPTPEPCECQRPTGFRPLGVSKGWPARVGMHDPDCKWHIRYHLRWWTEHGPDWSDWQPSDGDRCSCACGFNGTPDECAASRGAGAESRRRMGSIRPTSWPTTSRSMPRDSDE